MALETIIGGTAASLLGVMGSTINIVVGMQPIKEWVAGCKTRLIAES
jgi:hypothetical protein